MRTAIRPSLAMLVAACYTILTMASWGTAAAAQPRPYFLEFRSRPGYLIGHTYIVYGTLDKRGRPKKFRYAGNYPLDGQPGLILGSVIAVPSSVRGVRDDYEERPSNIYRLRLTARQFARLEHVLYRLRKSEQLWNLLFANCNDFAIEVADGLGLNTPPSWLLPEYFIAGMRVMNAP